MTSSLLFLSLISCYILLFFHSLFLFHSVSAFLSFMPQLSAPGKDRRQSHRPHKPSSKYNKEENEEINGKSMKKRKSNEQHAPPILVALPLATPPRLPSLPSIVEASP
jgi:hypothetical protein